MVSRRRQVRLEVRWRGDLGAVVVLVVGRQDRSRGLVGVAGDGVEGADSLVVNPHKWLFTPFDCSAFFIRRPAATVLLTIAIALTGVASYFVLPVSALPSIDIPTIQVSASLPGASAA